MDAGIRPGPGENQCLSTYPGYSYAVVPSIMDYRGYRDILKIGLGSCSPKHFLLCEMFQRLGLPVLYVVYPHRWEEIAKIMGEYSEKAGANGPGTAGQSSTSPVKLKSTIGWCWVDATIDLPLQKAGFTVNAGWDGKSDMLLPVTPIGC